MGRGRPPKGLTHIDSLTPDPESRKRLKAVLATLMGQMTVAEACSRLSLSESRFHELRRRALSGMVDGLEPRPPGRPPQPVEDEEVSSLKKQVDHLREELQISRLRTEIALWKPSLLRDPVRPPEKKGSSAKDRRRKKKPRNGGGRTAT
jgi:transposase-like protein